MVAKLLSTSFQPDHSQASIALSTRPRPSIHLATQCHQNAMDTAADRSAERKRRHKEREEEDITEQCMLEEEKLKREEEKKMKTAAATALKEEAKMK